jgi:hypothetical protein
MSFIHARSSERKAAIEPPSLRTRDSFHEITGRIDRPPAAFEEQILSGHSEYWSWRELSDRGWWYAPSPEACSVVIVNPGLQAIKVLISLNCVVTKTEFARDSQDPDGRLQDIFRKNFIHVRQVEYYRYRYEGKTDYTAPPGRSINFVGYLKMVGNMHIECRARGRTLRRAGIHTAIDLTSFDHDYFWEKRWVFRTYSRYWLEKYLGVDEAYQLWKDCDGVVQKMMHETKLVITHDKRQRAFPLVEPFPTSSGWKLVFKRNDRVVEKSNGTINN